MPLIETGSKAPAFTLADQNDVQHNLAECAGRPVVLYFYPKDDTSGCTKQACAFQELLPKFEKSRAIVFGVSPDDVASHNKFAGKYNLEFPLLADVPAADSVPPTCDAYGVWQEKSMYGRTYMGVVRTTYLIDGSGVVVQRWDKVKVAGHAETVRDAVFALGD